MTIITVIRLQFWPNELLVVSVQSLQPRSVPKLLTCSAAAPPMNVLITAVMFWLLVMLYLIINIEVMGLVQFWSP